LQAFASALQAQLLAQIGASGCQQHRNSMWLPAKPVKGKPNLWLHMVVSVLRGVSGCQFQPSSTRLIALAAARQAHPSHPKE